MSPIELLLYSLRVARGWLSLFLFVSAPFILIALSFYMYFRL